MEKQKEKKTEERKCKCGEPAKKQKYYRRDLGTYRESYEYMCDGCFEVFKKWRD